MQDIVEKLMNEDQEDRYDPKKNLRSKMIDMFYTEGFSLVGERQAATGRYLEFKKDDDVIKVFI